MDEFDINDQENEITTSNKTTLKDISIGFIIVFIGFIIGCFLGCLLVFCLGQCFDSDKLMEDVGGDIESTQQHIQNDSELFNEIAEKEMEDFTRYYSGDTNYNNTTN